jgi:hypothetical protein
MHLKRPAVLAAAAAALVVLPAAATAATAATAAEFGRDEDELRADFRRR